MSDPPSNGTDEARVPRPAPTGRAEAERKTSSSLGAPGTKLRSS